MFYVKVEDGTVTDRADFDKPMPGNWPEYDSWHQDDAAQIGWTFNGTSFAPPPLPRSFNESSNMGKTIRDIITGA